jgi:hypothetical protein
LDSVAVWLGAQLNLDALAVSLNALLANTPAGQFPATLALINAGMRRFANCLEHTLSNSGISLTPLPANVNRIPRRRWNGLTLWNEKCSKIHKFDLDKRFPTSLNLIILQHP